MIEDTITSFPHKRGLPEEKMAIGNIGTGSISTLAKLNTGRDHLQVAFGYTGGQHRSVYFAERMAERLAGTDGVEIEVAHAARFYRKSALPENLSLQFTLTGNGITKRKEMFYGSY